MFCGEFFPVLYWRSYPHVQRLTFHLQSLSVFYPFSCINLGFISTLAILHVSACFSWTLGQFISVLCISSFPVPAPRSYCVSALLSVASGLPFVTLDFGLRTSLTLNKAFCSFTFLGRLKVTHLAILHMQIMVFILVRVWHQGYGLITTWYVFIEILESDKCLVGILWRVVRGTCV